MGLKLAAARVLFDGAGYPFPREILCGLFLAAIRKFTGCLEQLL